MKKVYILLTSLVIQLGILAQSTYNGNANTGFGGAIGTSTLAISDNGTNVTFILTRGAGNLNDILVLYFDSKTGGFNSTSTLTDNADDHRRAITGKPGGGTSNITFASGFEADYAVTIGTSYAGFWELNTGSLNAVSSLGTPPLNNFSTFTFTLSKTQLGITSSTIGFTFVGTYLSGTSFRSNEGYSAGLPTSNPGWSDVTYSSFFTYPLVITPLHLSNFTGSVKNEAIELRWVTLSESNLSKFILQKSSNGLNFVDLAEIDPKNIPTGAVYTHTDPNPNIGNNFYRIIARNNTGEKAYSNVVPL
jgi:hypothetical protein